MPLFRGSVLQAMGGTVGFLAVCGCIAMCLQSCYRCAARDRQTRGTSGVPCRRLARAANEDEDKKRRKEDEKAKDHLKREEENQEEAEK